MSTLIAQRQGSFVHESTLKYYGQLIGATIQHIVLVGDVFGEALPVLIVKTADGKMKQVELWSDPEGNDVGHFDISDYTVED